ncbi:MAG: hypothetical protein PWP20_1612 [Eubacteriaceae bacterium]|nr:hypothetical protein [Eubacteriaceae bacterium]
MITNQWYAILPSKAVKTNQIVGVKRLNLELALFRNANGQIGCVVDQCTHRGAALSLGKVKGDCLQCPFHGLEFDPSGRCTFIPANGKSSTQDLSRYKVKSYAVREGNDIIFFWYGDPDKITDQLPFFNTDVDDSYVYSEILDQWHSHYSRSIENQLDVVHLPFVHHNTIGRGNKTLVNGPKVEFLPGGLVTSANNEVDVGQKPKKAAECIIKPTYLKFLFPNLWMNHISDKIKVIIYFAPVDDENTVLYIRFYQDKRVVITQRPKASAYKSQENLLSGDGPIIQYRRIREELKNQ